jgi:hypothetical protein
MKNKFIEYYIIIVGVFIIICTKKKPQCNRSSDNIKKKKACLNGHVYEILLVRRTYVISYQ